MTVSALLDQLVAIQADLHITSPIDATVATAYKYAPPVEIAVPARTWQNEWSLASTGLRDDAMVTVRMQFLAGEAIGNTAQTLDIATAFWEALVAALYPTSLASLASLQTLGGTTISHTLRGNQPTVGWGLRGGKAWIVADGYLDARMAFGIGADP